MKKYILFILVVFLSVGFAFGQVGINTVNPQGVFHVDGGKNNPVTGVPDATQEMDDLILTATGKMGIGTVSPTETLDINGTLRARSLPVTTNESEILELVSPTGVIKKGLLAESKIPRTASFSVTLAGGANTIISLAGLNVTYSLVTVSANNTCGNTMVASFIKVSSVVSSLGAQAENGLGTWTLLDANGNNGKISFANVIPCADGGNSAQFDFSIQFDNTNGLTITNLGNVSKTYKIRFVTRL